ncbi:MAG TPA: hypothetical protein EYP98_07090, partial [Planctomycetes bacterium]|nr:hypothetical protein [Planctomycetota bacterium]
MIADDLSRIAMSSNLSATLARGADYARQQGHFEVTLEHMLLSLCEDPDAGLVLAASNIDLDQLRGEVANYLGSREPMQGLYEVALDMLVKKQRVTKEQRKQENARAHAKQRQLQTDKRR